MSKIVHRKQFADGRATPHDVFCATAFPPNERCLCGRRPVAQITVYMPLDEARKRGLLEGTEGLEMELHKMLVQLRQDKHSKPTPHIAASRVYTCQSCRKEAEKAAAKAPSYCYVDIYEAPKDNAIITSG